jgi:hypothetical protein
LKASDATAEGKKIQQIIIRYFLHQVFAESGNGSFIAEAYRIAWTDGVAMIAPAAIRIVKVNTWEIATVFMVSAFAYTLTAFGAGLFVNRKVRNHKNTSVFCILHLVRLQKRRNVTV